ncbi:MAG TPA: hypothetical protein VGQ29_01915 [Gemmatimonadales bacterium]|jgi:hypothetical protein|nr:hypothetical protein [Gemmatimonadales bacterium]
MALRGAWFLLPVLLIIMAVTNPLEAWRAFLAILVYAPLGGVLGGLVYATIRSVTRSLGRLGTFIQCLGASCGYAFILSFLVLPTFKGKPMPSFSDQSEWITVAVIGMIGGIAIGIPLSRERA